MWGEKYLNGLAKEWDYVIAGMAVATARCFSCEQQDDFLVIFAAMSKSE
jgi:hypothetical protein